MTDKIQSERGQELLPSEHVRSASYADASLSSPATRIDSLDVLRGFAVLGILVMNIQSFAMVGSAYGNPSSWGDMSGIEGVVWYVSHLFADSKFMAIFSMLFGAGIVLMSNRQRQAGLSAAQVHYRRMLGLFGIGMIHAYLFWYGDILVLYAICGSIVFWMWPLRVRWLLLGSAALLLTGLLITLFLDWSIQFMTPGDYEELQNDFWAPSAEEISYELKIHRGPWFPQFFYRVEVAVLVQTFGLLLLGWRVSGLMLLGMAIMKIGFLSGCSSTRSYWAMLFSGLVMGLPLVVYGVQLNQGAGWQMDYSMFAGTMPNYVGSVLIALGYISLFQLLMRTDLRRCLVTWLAPVGRMALTNYLAQTLICTTLFYGHGFALYGSVSRFLQLMIVFGIWLIQILFSRFWMARFRFGPCEYVWRTLTYLRFLPKNLRKKDAPLKEPSNAFVGEGG
ncbi:MAG: DUF418 domain-containing protein [Planctomycetaceae bacterium]|nr:DUF418 domain-containing protein [Planctomycetaceae bacterium]